MDDDIGFNCFTNVTFLLPSLLIIFSTNNEINVKDSEKSLITSILGSIAKKYFIHIFGYCRYHNSKYDWDLKLEVENSFINYFDKETEIYKGMKKIDDELGGTTLKYYLKISRTAK